MQAVKLITIKPGSYELSTLLLYELDPIKVHEIQKILHIFPHMKSPFPWGDKPHGTRLSLS